MIEILQAWLKDAIGVVVELDEFRNAVKDGMLFIRILRFYDVINISSMKNVFPSDDKIVCKNNLMQLKMWFELIGIDFTNNIINEIIEGNLSTCINVLYQLYSLYVRNHLYLPTKQKERLIKNQYNERYKVSQPHLQNEEDCVGSAVYKYKCGDNILKNKNLLEWYERKHKCKKIKCSSINNAQSNKVANVANDDYDDEGNVENKAKIITNTGNKKYCQKRLIQPQSSQKSADDIYFVRHKLNKISDCSTLNSCEKCVGHNEAISRSRVAKNRRYDLINNFLSSDYIQRNVLPPISLKPVCEHELPSAVERYLQELKGDTGFLCKKPIIRSHVSSVIKSAWDNFVIYEKNDLKEIITSKLLKPSMFEKDLAAKFSWIKRLNEVQKSCFSDLESKVVKARKSLFSINVSDPDEFAKEKKPEAANGDYDNKNNDDYSFSYFDTIRHRYKYDDYNTYWLNEKKRTVELHRKLYAEKLKLQFDRHYAICSQTLKDMIDLGIKRSEFKKEYNVDVPDFIWEDWKCLFQHEQHIFDIVNDFEELLFPLDPMEIDIVKEKGRQDILNENCFDSYVDVTCRWQLLNRSLSFETRKNMINNDNQLILGYIVHRALETKYPVAPRPKPADIPSYSITAVINGINDMEAVNNLKDLLLKAEILVVDVHAAINFCLQCYKEQNDSNIYVPHNEVESDYDSYASQGDMEWEQDDSSYNFKSDFTQTASSLFDVSESGTCQEAARLGYDLFKTMLFGHEIAIGILVDIIIQYIKHHNNKIKGWVLVNFPSTLYQASVLEYALSGKKFPFHLDDDTVSSNGSECKGSALGNVNADGSVTDVEVEVRSSRIVPNPRKYEGDDTFKSYFKMYITAVKGDYQQNGSFIEENDSFNDRETKSTQLLEQPEKEGIPTLHQFYEDQGISFDLIYETLDWRVVKELFHVIGLYFCVDANRIEKLSADMEEGKGLLNDFESNVLLQWNVPSVSVDEVSFLKLGYDQRLSVVHIDEQELISIANMDTVSSLNKTEETSRNYTDYPVQENAMIALATFWEALETAYINGIKEVFFLKRNTNYCTIPYLAFINKRMHSFLNRDDDRQAILSEFLDGFNTIHNILRPDYDMRNELHLRVVEFGERLIRLCEEKRDEVEEMRRTIIKQNWTYMDLASYVNAFLRMAQLEINRCLGTLEYSQDYYLAMLGNYNSQPLPKLVVSKINVYKNEEIDGEVIGMSKTSVETEAESVAQEPELDLESNDLYSAVINRFLNYNEIKDNNSPFYDLVETKFDKAFQEVLKVVSQVEKVISSEEVSALKMHKDKMISKYSAKKGNAGNEGNASKKNKKQDKAGLSGERDLVNEEAVAKRMAQEQKDEETNELLLKNLFEEWKDVVKYELNRLVFRFEIIKEKARFEFKEMESLVGGKFADFNRELNQRFVEEKSCIDDLCFLFHTAIEEKTPIKAELFFRRNQFYAVTNPVVRQIAPVKLPPALDEVYSEESFTVKQLERLKERLVAIAPNGIVTIEAFAQFIQGFILYDVSYDKMKLVPSIWRELKPQELLTLFLNMFGSYSIFEWKEFLIYCLGIPFPVMEDIIDARLQFLQYDQKVRDSVSYEDYMKTTLWFERELPENPLQALHNILVKEFIFSLFSVDDASVNYIALLLSFCKDIDPKVGFGKALALILGRCVIVYEEDLGLEQILSDNIGTKFKVVNKILDEILNDVFSNYMLGEQESLLSLRQFEDSLDGSILSCVSSSDSNVVLMESMYHEFFRKHSVLQWTSKVPSTVIMSLLCLAISAVYVPDRVFMSTDVLIAIQQRFSKSSDDYVYVPEFVNSFWIEMIFKQTHKFNAFSVKTLIKDILLEREK